MPAGCQATEYAVEGRRPVAESPLALLGVKIAGTALWDYKDLQKRKQIAKSDTLQKIKSEYTKDIVRHDVKALCLIFYCVKFSDERRPVCIH